MIFGKKTKTKQSKQYVDQNPIEAVTHIGSGVASSLSRDLLSGGANDFWKQMVGEATPQKQTHGDLQEGQEISLSSEQKDIAKAMSEIAPGIDYRREILYGTEQLTKKETQILSQQIESIVMELKQLAAASKELETQFKDVVAPQRISKPGKYHQSFFSWILTMVQSARVRIEDAGMWISAMQNKKSKKNPNFHTGINF